MSVLSLASATDTGGAAAPSLVPSVSGRPATTTGNGDLRVCAEDHVGDVSGWARFVGLEVIEDACPTWSPPASGGVDDEASGPCRWR
ncbi:hypothetical protein [Micromonospora sp. WMMD712]|uniref:hypothetical protein n=1 Tax=Micromonospora sp. WMMD712 TaxID=3016096 RepID=UPI00249A3DEA|nr:hypothetical protein [Micromonospora sp. WMMD712]WFE59664.1 hypothetical protein O7633_23665 [Micromonospora sp. WMMD712]